MRLRELMNFLLIILNILLTRWLLVLICSLKLNLTQMIPSFLLLRVFVILLVCLMKTCLIRISLLLVLLCFHLAVPEFSAHATVSSSSSQSSGYSNISRLTNEMFERLVISLSYLIHFFWNIKRGLILVRSIQCTIHLVILLIYIILLHLNDQRLKAWFATEEIPAEQASFMLPVRYPDDFTWDKEVRLLFPVFLNVDPCAYFVTGRNRTIVPYTTLMQAS